MSLDAYKNAKKEIDDHMASDKSQSHNCKETHDNITAFMEKHSDQKSRDYMATYLYLKLFLRTHSPCIVDDVLGDTWVSFARQHGLNYSDEFLRQVYLIEFGIPVPLS